MKTTAKQFKLFRESFEQWKDYLRLDDWKVYFLHEKLNGCFAAIQADLDCSVATVFMNTELDKEDAIVFIPEDHAKHEALHLLTMEVVKLGGRRCVTEEELERADERLIRRLERIIERLGRIP